MKLLLLALLTIAPLAHAEESGYVCSYTIFGKAPKYLWESGTPSISLDSRGGRNRLFATKNQAKRALLAHCQQRLGADYCARLRNLYNHCFYYLDPSLREETPEEAEADRRAAEGLSCAISRFNCGGNGHPWRRR
jgi:hypothetical protein